MIRETVEMIPIALVLAAIFGLGSPAAVKMVKEPAGAIDRGNRGSRGSGIGSEVGTKIHIPAGVRPGIRSAGIEITPNAISRMLRFVDDGMRTGIIPSSVASLTDSDDGKTKATKETSGKFSVSARKLPSTRTPSRNPIFIPRHSCNSKVPFYTSKDISRVLGNRSFSSKSKNRFEIGGGDRGSNGGWSGGKRQEQTARHSTSKISINSADIMELTSIPGIGVVRARMIVEARPRGGYRSWNELVKIPGIGERTLEMIRIHAGLI